jgi:hypothetical protein
MDCQHDKVYVKTFEQGRLLWICRTCLKTGSDADDGSADRNFDTEEYFRLLTHFNNAARERSRAAR